MKTRTNLTRASRIVGLLAIVTVMAACGLQAAEPPSAWKAIPSERQLAWHETEYYALVHYAMGTYVGQEWPWGNDPPEKMNPVKFDADQWCRTFKAAGMKGIVMFCKHHDGFCNWQSAYTDYCFKSSPWRNGKGDMMADLAAACKKHGMKLGVYYSPWDRNHADWGRPEYLVYLKNQVRELLTNYGDIFMLWCDGANGRDGYYGGANEARLQDGRMILHEYYMPTFREIVAMTRQLQPNACVFGSGAAVDVRWIGNESGAGSPTNWCRINTEPMGYMGYAIPVEKEAEFLTTLQRGDEDGKEWAPAESDTALRTPYWFWRSTSRPKNLKRLVDTYYETIGYNTSLDLGISINPDGEIPPDDVDALMALKRQIDRDFAVNLIEKAHVAADNVRGNDARFAPSAVADNDKDTYWATDDGVRHAEIVIDFEKPTTFNRLLLQEFIRLGQRVDGFTLDAFVDGRWQKVADSTTIGYKRILRFSNVTAPKARVTFETKAPCLAISKLGVYLAPVVLDNPTVSRNRDGQVSIAGPADTKLFFAMGEHPTDNEFREYNDPFPLRNSGTVFAYATDPVSNAKTDIVSLSFGIAKEKWRIASVSSENTDIRNNAASLAIDDDPNTIWHTEWANGKMPSHPHHIAMDLGETVDMTGFSYLPRKEQGGAGVIFDYEFYVSIDGENWGDSVATGQFGNIENNPVRQDVVLRQVARGRYVKLVSRSAVKGLPYAGAAEIDVFGHIVGETK